MVVILYFSVTWIHNLIDYTLYIFAPSFSTRWRRPFNQNFSFRTICLRFCMLHSTFACRFFVFVSPLPRSHILLSQRVFIRNKMTRNVRHRYWASKNKRKDRVSNLLPLEWQSSTLTVRPPWKGTGSNPATNLAESNENHLKIFKYLFKYLWLMLTVYGLYPLAVHLGRSKLGYCRCPFTDVRVHISMRDHQIEDLTENLKPIPLITKVINNFIWWIGDIYVWQNNLKDVCQNKA